MAVTLDKNAMLVAGEHPMGIIPRYLADVESGSIRYLRSSLPPSPRVDAMRNAGSMVDWLQTGESMWATFVRGGERRAGYVAPAIAGSMIALIDPLLSGMRQSGPYD